MSTAADLMTKKMVTVPPHMHLTELAALLEKRRISGCPVVDDQGVVVGVVSVKDLTRARAKGDDMIDLFYSGAGLDEMIADEYSVYADEEAEGLSELTVGDVMSPRVFSVQGKTPVQEVAKQMVDRRVQRFLVIDDGHFVGIISSTDILRDVAGVPRV